MVRQAQEVVDSTNTWRNIGTAEYYDHNDGPVKKEQLPQFAHVDFLNAPLRKGDKVEVFGLTEGSIFYNDMHGEIISEEQDSKGRHQVRFCDGTERVIVMHAAHIRRHDVDYFDAAGLKGPGGPGNFLPLDECEIFVCGNVTHVMQSHLKEKGATITKEISYNTRYVLQGDKAPALELHVARSRGIEIVNKRWMLKRIGAPDTTATTSISTQQQRKSKGNANNMYWNEEKAIVVKRIEGKGKYFGMMGKLVCKTKQGVHLQVSRGFTTQQRMQEWRQGTIIAYKFKVCTRDAANVLRRWPSFLRVCYDDDGQTEVD